MYKRAKQVILLYGFYQENYRNIFTENKGSSKYNIHCTLKGMKCRDTDHMMHMHHQKVSRFGNIVAANAIQHRYIFLGIDPAVSYMFSTKDSRLAFR